MSVLDKLKKQRTKKFEDLSQKINDQKKSYEDNRYWRPELDKSGNAYAVIRFLPSKFDDDTEYAKMYQHFFQDDKSGKYFVENCPTSLGNDHECPVCEANSTLWNTGIKENKDVASKRKRKLQYHANILVVEDEKNPENEGQVFLFRFGPQIFEKIEEAMHPKFPDEPQFNPFDLWESKNFTLKIYKNQYKMSSYDKSSFAGDELISVVDKDGNEVSEKVLEKMIESTHRVKDFVEPDNYNSYEDIKKKFYRLVNTEEGAENAPTKSASGGESDGDEEFKPKFNSFDESDSSKNDVPDDDDDDDPFKDFDLDDDDDNDIPF